PEEYPGTQAPSVAGPSAGDRGQRPGRCGVLRSGPVRFMVRAGRARGPPGDLDDPEGEQSLERCPPVARIALTQEVRQAAGKLAVQARCLESKPDPPEA